MNSPLILILPFILLLAWPTYAVMRDRKRSNERMGTLEAQGFNADIKFDMHDMYVALDTTGRKIAFVNVELQCFPPGRSSYSAHFTIVEPYSNLDQITVQYSDKLILLDVTFHEPNTFNSTRKMSFYQAPQSKSKVQALVAAWPGAAANIGTDALPVFSFREVGTILAGSVAEGLTNFQFSVQELELVSQADVDLNVYKQELYLLQSASAFMAAGELISESVTASEVKAGFVSYWNDAANNSPQMMSLRNSFQLRFPAYAHAIHADRTERDPNQLHINQICQTFANSLGISAGRSEASPKELVFAMMGLPIAYWEAARDSAKLLFAGAKLPINYV